MPQATLLRSLWQRPLLPFVNMVFRIDDGPRNPKALVLAWDLFWIVFYIAVTAGLMLATVLAFERRS